MRVASRRVRALPHTGGARTPRSSDTLTAAKKRQKRLSAHIAHDQKAAQNVHYEFQLRAQCDSVSALQKCGAYRGVDGIVWNYPALRAREHVY